MATIQELYGNRGNPDLSHWKTKKLLTISEAALLTCGFEPLELDHLAEFQLANELREKKPCNWQYVLMLINSIAEAICTHEIKSPYVVFEYPYNDGFVIEEQSKISFSDEPYLKTTLTKIHRDELFKWLKKNGYLEPTQQAEIQVNQVQSYHQESTHQSDVILLAAPIYTTPPLEALNGVIAEFWADYDPDDQASTPPKQGTVEAWIKQHYPDVQGNAMCTYIDKICRHPKARTGGNKKAKP